MAVTWVAGSTAVFGAGVTSISGTTPAGIANGDTLLAAVFGRSALTTPSGWTKLIETAEVTNANGFLQRMAVFSKNTVTTADASASFTFSQATSDRIGLAYAVVRGASDVSYLATAVSNSVTWSVAPSAMTASANGSIIISFATSILGGGFGTGSSGTGFASPTPPTSFTLTTGASLETYRLAGAYRTADSGQANSGSFNFSPGETAGSNGLAAVTLMMADTTPAPAPKEVRAAATGPLGAASLRARHYSSGVRAAVASPLGAMLAQAFHDFSKLVENVDSTYLMDLSTPAGVVRVPISSWQATLRADEPSYVQCVVPGAAAWVDAIVTATSFAITRRAVSTTGSVVEVIVASAPIEAPSLAQGGFNYSATLSGYSAAINDSDAIMRELQKIRTIFTYPAGFRVRCAVDWLLRPGHTATFSGGDFTVRYISYYVQDNDAFMDVGQ